MVQIKIKDFTVDIIRKNISNIHLSVYPPTGRIRIAAPLHIDDTAIKLFAISKLAWIRKQQRAFIRQERQAPRNFVDRESHYFEGRRYLLRVTENDSVPKIVVSNKTYLDFYVRPNTSSMQRAKIMDEWYRGQLKNKIPTIISKWEQIIGVQVNDWGVKKMKTKWGTCKIEEKRIWLNLELAKKPNKCLEFIIVHEMVHLIERRHNDVFFSLISKFLPNWKNIKNELNNLPTTDGNWEY